MTISQEIQAWDPFCLAEPKTQLLAEDTLSVQLPDGSEGSFKIQAYLLPRKSDFEVLDKNNSQISNDYEGFYVYRENRLIHFGDWLNMFKNDTHLSYLRINFSFDSSLDEAFSVDIKKSRILPDDGIMAYLKEHFIPAPKNAALQFDRIGQTQATQKSSENAHDASNKNIEGKAKNVERAKVDVINPETNEVSITNAKGTFTGKIKILQKTEPGKTRIIPVPSIDSGLLWEPTIAEGQQAVSINQSHPYYLKVYGPYLNENPNLIMGLDSLLWALSEAEIGTYNDTVKEQYEDMRIQVSTIIKRLVADLPEPDFSKDNEE